MPRTRNANIQEITAEEIQEEMFNTRKLNLVETKLKNDYYEMKKKLNERIECCICMEAIDCIHCLALCRCGATIHLFEWLKCNKCPICRVNVI